MLKFLFTLLAGGGIFMNIDKLKYARWKKLEGIIFIYKHFLKYNFLKYKKLFFKIKNFYI